MTFGKVKESGMNFEEDFILVLLQYTGTLLLNTVYTG
jgi:hypothetical protein